MNASVIRFSVSGFGYEKMMNSTEIHGHSIVKLGFILKLSSRTLHSNDRHFIDYAFH